ncbi:MAG: antibiotic biosynthesis monooxygenase [Tannerellaceae bacterium]|jgi:quinol monooxygenase YgiN|nr:antibiotic biosynthesis monooxygenase [Tannerellaceae bacterium]
MKKGIKKHVLYGFLGSLLFLCSCAPGAKQQEATEEVNPADKLTIVATITILPEFKEEVLPVIQAVVAGTRTEPGNISYDVFEDVNNPLRFTFIEHWKSQSAIEAHNASPHFLEFVKGIEGKAEVGAITMKQKF